MTIDPSFEATIVNTLADLAEARPDLQGLALDAVVHSRRNGAGRGGDRIRASTSRRRSTCDSPQRPSKRADLGAMGVRLRRFARRRRRRSRSSSGRRRRGRCRPTSRSRCEPDADYGTLSRRRRAADPRRGARSASAGRALRASRDAAGARARRGSRRRSPCATVPGSRLGRSCWPITSISKRAPVPCTPRPATAPTTSRPAMKYGLPILNPVDAAGRFTAEARTVCRACTSSRPSRKSSTTSRAAGALERRRTTSIRIRTAGAARIRSSSARPRSGSSRWIATICGSACERAIPSVEWTAGVGRERAWRR